MQRYRDFRLIPRNQQNSSPTSCDRCMVLRQTSGVKLLSVVISVSFSKKSLKFRNIIVSLQTMNRTNLISILTLLLVLVMLGGCVSSEERAAQKAEYIRKVKVALDKRSYKISINRMLPMHGGSKSVSYGYFVTVRNDSLYSYLPYFGRAYDVPYGGGKGLSFEAPIGHYQETHAKSGLCQIDIELKNDEDNYSYHITVFDNGNSSIDVQSRKRDRISYTGEMIFEN